jgi:uroporphyrinogen decarboxylase
LLIKLLEAYYFQEGLVNQDTATLASRIKSVFYFQKPDRIPLIDWGFWDELFEQWLPQGLAADLVAVPEGEFIPGVDLRTYWGGAYNRKVTTAKLHAHFAVEPWLGQRTVPILDSIFPFFKEELLEDRGEIVVKRDREGIVLQAPKRGTAFPGFLDFPVKTPADYLALKPRLLADTPGRYCKGWDIYAKRMRDIGAPLTITFKGFFGFSRDLFGIENLAVAYYDFPDLLEMIARERCEFLKRLYAPLLSQFHLDYALIWEDMAYKNGSMISPKTFRRFMMPYYQELTHFFHNHGVHKIFVDCDGNIIELCRLLIEGGVDGVYPLEVAAGSDPHVLRERYPELVLVGGIDKRVLLEGQKQIDRELARVTPLIERGGYLPMLDHHVPADVPLANYQYYLARLRERL